MTHFRGRMYSTIVFYLRAEQVFGSIIRLNENIYDTSRRQWGREINIQQEK